MDGTSWAQDLIAISARLIALMEGEIEQLRAMRPSAIAALQDEKAALGRLYLQQLDALRKDPVRLSVMDDAVKNELLSVTSRYERALNANMAALLGARDANERLLRAIVAAHNAGTSAQGYGPKGEPGRAARLEAEPVALTLDRRL
jgi:hypothetical protein